MLPSFALFRLPYSSQCTLIEQSSGQPEEFAGCTDLNGRKGFVVAPFAPSAENPILLIRPDRMKTIEFDDKREQILKYFDLSLDMLLAPDYKLGTLEHPSAEHPSGDYHEGFQRFHNAVTWGDFQKLVLSRSVEVERTAGSPSPFDLFYKACAYYPRVMICLVCTPRTGLWLAATPEILLSSNDQYRWHTVALAGTKLHADKNGWSDKNIQEQRYVASYLAERLAIFDANYSEQGPVTVQAGHLAHLRSDFYFNMEEQNRVGDLLQLLHPTPAVCGLPKEKAFKFILEHEHNDRRYYSGFMGPLSIERQTNLFVTLRCMQIFPNAYRLYAGGGLLPDSVEEQEWQETETKLDTMRNLLRDENEESRRSQQNV